MQSEKETQQIAILFTTKTFEQYLEEIRNGQLKDFMDNGDPVRGAATLEYPTVDIEVNIHSKGQFPDGQPGDQTPALSYFCCRKDADGNWYSDDYLEREPNVDWNAEDWRRQLLLDMYQALQEYVAKDGYELCPLDDQLLQCTTVLHQERKERAEQHPYSITDLETLIHGVIRFAGDRSLSDGYACLEEMGFTREQMRFFGFDVDGALEELKEQYNEEEDE